MPETKIQAGAKELEVLQTLRKTGAVDFEKVGDLVKSMPDTIVGPGVVADDYIATGYTSVIKVWKTGISDLGLDEVAKVRDMATRFSGRQF